MKKLKKAFLIIAAFLILISLSLFIYLQTTKPQYEGEIGIKNISKNTEVYFDDFGIPHIYADNQKDAMVVLGYVHAQERLWQMELLRRIAPGRLSELFGSKVASTDMFFAGIGIDENSEQTVNQLDKNAPSYIMAMAYLDGVNQYVENGKTPLEYNLLGLKKEKFSLKDVHNIIGYMAFSFAMAHKMDPLMTEIKTNLGDQYLKDFGLDGSLGNVQIKNYLGTENKISEISNSISSLLNNAPIPPFIGSNSWVIGAEKTKNNKVIFANDPHIGFSQPCTWFEAHIECPNFESYGYYLAGVPFPLLNHNRNYAIGLTMFENDDVDLFLEHDTLNATQYKTPLGYEKYTYKKKVVKVKDSSDIVLNIKQSIHGPVLNGIMNTVDKKQPIAVSWIYTQQKNQILEAVYQMSQIKNLEDYKKSVSLIHAPGLNVMYGDAQNNIAWIASGKLYKLDSSVNPNFILDGKNVLHNKKEFLPFTKNPQAINPPWNYVYSANNQPEAVDGYLYPGYYLPKDRAQRIVSLLEPKNNWTATDVQNMLNDNTSNAVLNVVKSIVKNLDLKNPTVNEKKALEIFSSWKGTNNSNDIAPTLYNKFIYNYLEKTFKDELGEKSFTTLLGSHVLKQIIESNLANPNSVWWDNFNTKNKKETQKEIVTQAFNETILELQKQLGNDISKWTWDKVHSLEHEHPIGKLAMFRNFFNVGTFAVAGSNEVINNLMFTHNPTGIYNVKSGPSTRRVIDFSDVENSFSILPTGNSGNPMSKHYNDQAKMYNQGKFRKMKMNKKEILKTSTKLVFIAE